MTTAQIGKVKKRFLLRPFLTKIKKQRIKLTKKRIALVLALSVIVFFSCREIYSQVSNTLKDYYVFATPTQASSLNLNSNFQVTSDSGNTLAASTDPKSIQFNALTLDKRSYILDQYFLKNNSPLYGTGKIFIDSCDKYGAPRDCLVVAAIARNETDLCKYSNSAQMHNCWGFGGAGPNRINFKSFEESIDRVTQTLVFSYGRQYMIDPSLMEHTFCGPGCHGCGNSIKHFMNEIDAYGVSLGLGSMLAMR